MNTTDIIVEEGYAGTRLDAFLAYHAGAVPRSIAVEAITAEAIRVNGRPAKQHYRIKAGDHITGTMPEPEDATAPLVPDPSISLDILHETDTFLVLNKPVGLQVHPSATQRDHTLANALLAHAPQIATVGDDPGRPGIVHRLDKDTSGVMVVAKTQAAFEGLKKCFKRRCVEKTYLALVHGIPEKAEGAITAPLARSRAHTKQKVAQGKFLGEAKEAHTDYAVRETFHLRLPEVLTETHSDEASFALIEAKPKTGRTHQIRVHMRHIGHPIVGDWKYYTRTEKALHTQITMMLPEGTLPDHHLLHAQKLAFTLDGKDYAFEAPLPELFAHTVDTLRCQK